MIRIVFLFSSLLIALGLVAYFGFADASERSWTALIPAGLGVPLLVCGVIGLRESARKHAMHAAMVFALLGVVLPLGRLIPVSIKDGFVFDSKSGTMIGMSVLSLLLMVLGVRSFIAARRNAEAG